MAKFSLSNMDPSENKEHFVFHCPGCGHAHFVQVNKKSNPNWDFNGDIDNPTVSPSILVRGENAGGKTRCHSFVKNGQIQFLSDCTHNLVGQTVDIPEF